jgi:hypothetical protein
MVAGREGIIGKRLEGASQNLPVTARQPDLRVDWPGGAVELELRGIIVGVAVSEVESAGPGVLVEKAVFDRAVARRANPEWNAYGIPEIAVLEVDAIGPPQDVASPHLEVLQVRSRVSELAVSIRKSDGKRSHWHPR